MLMGPLIALQGSDMVANSEWGNSWSLGVDPGKGILLGKGGTSVRCNAIEPTLQSSLLGGGQGHVNQTGILAPLKIQHVQENRFLSLAIWQARRKKEKTFLSLVTNQESNIYIGG